jgi:hypothetical protein
VVVRTRVAPLEVEPAVQAALMSLDREAAMYQVRTGDERSAMAYSMQRFLMVLMASFAARALVLTVVGIYGLLAYAVAEAARDRLRITLGAGRLDVLGMVLRQGRAFGSGGSRSGPGWCRRSATAGSKASSLECVRVTWFSSCRPAQSS